MKKYDGFKTLLHFAYGPLLKGLCSDNCDPAFVKKVKLYLEGDYSLKDSIIDEIYEELPRAVPRLHQIAKAAGNEEDLFSKEIVNEYVFKVHSLEVMSFCAVKSGAVKSINKKKRTLEIVKNGKTSKVEYLPCLEGSFKVGDEVYFHHGWLIPND